MRVLVIEDESHHRLLFSIWLRTAGHEVVEAPNPGSALQTLALDSGFDVILCDLLMPDDGEHILDPLVTSYPHIPVVMISAQMARNWAERLQAKGAFAAIEKPVERDRLLAVLTAAAQAGALPNRRPSV